MGAAAAGGFFGTEIVALAVLIIIIAILGSGFYGGF